MTVLDHFPNLKRGLGLAFGACFLNDFSMNLLTKFSKGEGVLDRTSIFMEELLGKRG